MLLEALADELPQGTIRFSSKVVHIELSGYYKMVHLSDGTILKTKVLVLSVNNLKDRLVLLWSCGVSEPTFFRFW